MVEIAAGSKGGEIIDLGFVREAVATSRLGAGRQLRSPDKIEKAARDFESILLGHWLEQAQESLASVPGGNDDDEEDPAHFQLQGIGMQSLGNAITRAGGIGIAALIERHLQRQGGANLISHSSSEQGDTTAQNGTTSRGPSRQEKNAEAANEISQSADK